jgi:signal transduction histidine kinase
MNWLSKIWAFAPVQIKFLSLVIPLVLIFLVGTVAIMGNSARGYAMKREELSFEKIGLATADALAEAFWNYNLSQTDAIVLSLNLIPDLVAAKAVELENGVALNDSALNRSIGEIGHSGNHIYTRTFPIVYRENGRDNTLGSFEITYSLQSLDADTKQQLTTAVSASLLGALALIIGTAFALNRLILRPVAAVAASSRGAAQSDEATGQERFVPITWNTDDQMGTMVRDYNQLRKRLSQHAVSLSEQKALQTLEAERQRITMELHDGLGGSLVSLLARVKNASTINKEMLTAQLHESIDELGSIMDTLETDGDIDIVIAQVRRRIEPLFVDFRTTLTWKIGETLCVPEPGPKTASHLARIVREAITNALRHSRSTNICVQMTKETLIITDNGCGIAPGHDKGRGFQTMKRRAEYIGLVFEVRSGTGGTSIRLTNANI